MDGLSFIAFPIVGAVIGATTNHLAIKMLFHPYRAYHIGNWRIPMTPGLIPQQREHIAKNIAETFDANLLSGDDIHEIMTGPEAVDTMSVKVDEMLTQFGPFAAMAKPFKPKIVDAILNALEEYVTEAVSEGGDLNIRDKIEARINAMDVARLEQLIMGFSRKQFRYITYFGGLLGALIGVIQAGMAVALGAG